MPRKKRVTPDDPAQYARFAEIAEQNEAENAEQLFEEAFKKIAKAKPSRKKAKDDKSSETDFADPILPAFGKIIMADIFSSSRLRIGRAQKHILDLEQGVKAFFNTEPYSAVTESDPDGINQVCRIKLTQPFPAELTGIAADAVDNMRSALDQAWHAVAVACGAIEPSGEAYFPFGNSLSKFKRALNKGCRNFPPDIIALLSGFQPYKGGNDLLYTLNRICAANKHRVLAPVVLSPGEMRFLGGIISFGLFDMSKNEIIISGSTTSGIAEYTAEYNVQITFNVAFRKAGMASDEPAVTVLRKFLGIVDGIVAALEAECLRLKLI